MQCTTDCSSQLGSYEYERIPHFKRETASLWKKSSGWAHRQVSSLDKGQRNSGFSLQTPSPFGLLWKVQRFRSSSLKTQECAAGSLDSNSCSSSWVLASPFPRAWNAMKLRTLTSSSSYSVEHGARVGACWWFSSPSFLVCCGKRRWFLALILANKDEESSALDDDSPDFPSKWSLELHFFIFSFFTVSASCK